MHTLAIVDSMGKVFIDAETEIKPAKRGKSPLAVETSMTRRDAHRTSWRGP